MAALASPHTLSRPAVAESGVRSLRARITSEAALVVTLLALPQFLVLFGYYRGDISPQFDFLGEYSSEAFAWWRDGSFLHPLEWMPYTWGGYPAATALQSSAWYLPVGVVAMVTTYSIHVAAALQALHVAFGALGVYVLARRMNLGRLAASLGLIAGSFLPGFFANAQHVDIVRGYAWAPWVLLILSPYWPWKRWWSMPVAALLLWQALVGIYPGMVVSFVFAGAVWLVAHQIVRRPKVTQFMLPVATSVLVAGLLVSLKYLPALLVRGSIHVAGTDASVFGIGIFGTLFYPYDGSNLPTDMSMRSFFIPATCVALLALTPWRDGRARVAAATGAFCALVSLPVWPWFHGLQQLPGFSISRFLFSDYRPILLLCMMLLALVGLSKAIQDDAAARAEHRDPGELSWRRPRVLGALLAILAVAAATGLAGGFGAPRWAPAWSILLTASLAVAALAGIGHPRWKAARPDARILAVILIGLTLVSGTSWAFATQRPWRADRVSVEVGLWGTTSGGLIAQRGDPATASKSALTPARQRPARTPLPDEHVTRVDLQESFNSAYYTGIPAVGGYANLRGNAAFDAAGSAFSDPISGTDALALYAAPGLVIVAPQSGVPTAQAVTECAATGSCGDRMGVVPTSYRPGHLAYDVTNAPAGAVLLNESYYPGWVAEACTDQSETSCRPVPLSLGPAGVVRADVPAGSFRLTLDYATPGLATSWLLFWAGVGIALAWAAFALLVGVVKGRREQVRPSTS